MSQNRQKQAVHDYWEEASCGEDLYLSNIGKSGYRDQARARYALEGNLISGLAKFSGSTGLKVLEIGVGLGADHQKYADAGAVLYGIDLTERAVEHTRRRLSIFGLHSELSVGDAENLSFPDEFFDVVYSWGCLHHSSDTQKAISEVARVLKPSGEARIMIYHKWSMVGYMLWVRYALLRFRPWLEMSQIYSSYLESPGTKAYSIIEAKELFALFSQISIATPLTHGDLLDSPVGQRHRGTLLRIARIFWPRRLIRKFLPGSGLFMLIDARK